MIKTLDIAHRLPDGCVAFGPCVRKDWLGKASDRFDIAIEQRGMRDDVISQLREGGYGLNKVKTYKATTYRRTEYTVDKNGSRGTLNVYSPVDDDGEEFTIDDVIEARYSADVNRLWMDSTGNIDVSEGCGFTLDEITENISSKKYKVCDENFGDTEAYELSKDNYTQYVPKKKVVDKFVEPKPINSKNETHTKEIGKMGTKADGFMGMIKVDAENAAYRVAATQISNGTKGAILAIMEKQGHGSDRIKAISDLLDTEFGTALISLLVGAGLTYAPHISEDPRVARLAGEFRVNGMATAGNAIFETATQHFLPVIMNAISALPPPAEAAEDVKIRVPAQNETAEAESEEDEDEQKVAAPPRKMSA